MPVSDSQPVSVGDLKEVMGEVEPRISDLEERPGGGSCCSTASATPARR